MMKLFTHLVFGCFYASLFWGASFASLPNQTDLSPEEKQYVLLECETFAVDDAISPEHYFDYIETCVEELGAAVQLAIDQLQTKSESSKVNISQENR